MKRIVSWVICINMLMGMVPARTFAEPVGDLVTPTTSGVTYFGDTTGSDEDVHQFTGDGQQDAGLVDADPPVSPPINIPQETEDEGEVPPSEDDLSGSTPGSADVLAEPKLAFDVNEIELAVDYDPQTTSKIRFTLTDLADGGTPAATVSVLLDGESIQNIPVSADKASYHFDVPDDLKAGEYTLTVCLKGNDRNQTVVCSKPLHILVSEQTDGTADSADDIDTDTDAELEADPAFTNDAMAARGLGAQAPSVSGSDLLLHKKGDAQLSRAFTYELADWDFTDGAASLTVQAGTTELALDGAPPSANGTSSFSTSTDLSGWAAGDYPVTIAIAANSSNDAVDPTSVGTIRVYAEVGLTSVPEADVIAINQGSGLTSSVAKLNVAGFEAVDTETALINFFVGGVPAGTAPIDGNGDLTYTLQADVLSALTPGAHSITATVTGADHIVPSAASFDLGTVNVSTATGANTLDVAYNKASTIESSFQLSGWVGDFPSSFTVKVGTLSCAATVTGVEGDTVNFTANVPASTAHAVGAQVDITLLTGDGAPLNRPFGATPAIKIGEANIKTQPTFTSPSNYNGFVVRPNGGTINANSYKATLGAANASGYPIIRFRLWDAQNVEVTNVTWSPIQSTANTVVNAPALAIPANALSGGCYKVTIESQANNYNMAIPQIQVGSLYVQHADGDTQKTINYGTPTVISGSFRLLGRSGAYPTTGLTFSIGTGTTTGTFVSGTAPTYSFDADGVCTYSFNVTPLANANMAPGTVQYIRVTIPAASPNLVMTNMVIGTATIGSMGVPYVTPIAAPYINITKGTGAKTINCTLGGWFGDGTTAPYLALTFKIFNDQDDEITGLTANNVINNKPNGTVTSPSFNFSTLAVGTYKMTVEADANEKNNALPSTVIAEINIIEATDLVTRQLQSGYAETELTYSFTLNGWNALDANTQVTSIKIGTTVVPVTAFPLKDGINEFTVAVPEGILPSATIYNINIQTLSAPAVHNLTSYVIGKLQVSSAPSLTTSGNLINLHVGDKNAPLTFTLQGWFGDTAKPTISFVAVKSGTTAEISLGSFNNVLPTDLVNYTHTLFASNNTLAFGQYTIYGKITATTANIPTETRYELGELNINSTRAATTAHSVTLLSNMQFMSLSQMPLLVNGTNFAELPTYTIKCQNPATGIDYVIASGTISDSSDYKTDVTVSLPSELITPSGSTVKYPLLLTMSSTEHNKGFDDTQFGLLTVNKAGGQRIGVGGMNEFSLQAGQLLSDGYDPAKVTFTLSNWYYGKGAANSAPVLKIGLYNLLTYKLIDGTSVLTKAFPVESTDGATYTYEWDITDISDQPLPKGDLRIIISSDGDAYNNAFASISVDNMIGMVHVSGASPTVTIANPLVRNYHEGDVSTEMADLTFSIAGWVNNAGAPGALRASVIQDDATGKVLGSETFSVSDGGGTFTIPVDLSKLNIQRGTSRLKLKLLGDIYNEPQTITFCGAVNVNALSASLSLNTTVGYPHAFVNKRFNLYAWNSAQGPARYTLKIGGETVATGTASGTLNAITIPDFVLPKLPVNAAPGYPITLTIEGDDNNLGYQDVEIGRCVINQLAPELAPSTKTPKPLPATVGAAPWEPLRFLLRNWYYGEAALPGNPPTVTFKLIDLGTGNPVAGGPADLTLAQNGINYDAEFEAMISGDFIGNLPVGNYKIVASVAGDANNEAILDTDVIWIQVNAAAPRLAAQGDGQISVQHGFGASTQIGYQLIDWSFFGSGSPEVKFKLDGDLVATVNTLTANGSFALTLDLSALAVGEHILTANAAGNINNDGIAETLIANISVSKVMANAYLVASDPIVVNEGAAAGGPIAFELHNWFFGSDGIQGTIAPDDESSMPTLKFKMYRYGQPYSVSIADLTPSVGDIHVVGSQPDWHARLSLSSGFVAQLPVGNYWLCASGAGDGGFNNAIPEGAICEIRVVPVDVAGSHIVTFYDFDDTILDCQRIADGKSAIPPKDPVRGGHNFAGWDKNFSNITGDLSVKATYTPITTITLAIRYQYEDGTQIHPSYLAVIRNGTTVPPVASPVIAGFTADLLVVDFGVPDASDTVIVTYTGNPIEFTVYHYQQNATDENYTKKEQLRIQAKTGDMLQTAFKSYPGFQPIGDAPLVRVTPENNHADLRYVRQLYPVEFHVNGGLYIEPWMLRVGEPIGPLPSPSRAGYAFGGWFEDDTFETPAVLPATMGMTDIALYAKWTPVTVNYTVAYWLEKSNIAGTPGANDYLYQSSVLATALSEATVTRLAGDPTLPSFYTSYGVNYPFAEFSHADTITVNGDGTSVLNVYFNRILFTVSFDLDVPGMKMTVGGDTYYTDGPEHEATGLYRITAKYQQSINTVYPYPPVASVQAQAGAFAPGTCTGWKPPQKAEPVFPVETAARSRITAFSDALVPPKGTTSYTMTAYYLAGAVTWLNYYWDEVLPGDETAECRQLAGYPNRFFGPRPGSPFMNVKSIKGTTSTGSFTGFTHVLAVQDYVWQDDDPDGVGDYRVDFYATRNRWNIEFRPVGGTAVASIPQVYYGSPLDTLEPVPPTRPNYTFDGWYRDEDYFTRFDFVGNKMPDGGVLLYAKWVPRTCEVRFETNGGSDIPAQTVQLGAMATRPPAPTRTNFVFVRWCKDADLKEPFSFAQNINDDMELYAMWRPTAQVSYTTHYKLSVAPFTPLADDTVEMGMTGDNVGLVAKGIDGYMPQKRHGALTLSADPSRNEYSFLYKPAREVNYVVRYVEMVQGVETDIAPVKRGTTNNARIIEPAANISGYTPLLASQPLLLSLDESENVLVFVYEAAPLLPYTVGVFLETMQGSYDEVVALNLTGAVGSQKQLDPTQYVDLYGDNYTVNTLLSNLSDYVTSNVPMELSLYFNLKKFTLAYDANGGVGARVNELDRYPIAISHKDTYVRENDGVSGVGFTLSGSVFLGWNTKPDGNGKDYRPGDTLPDGNIVLYAQWSRAYAVRIVGKTLTAMYNGSTQMVSGYDVYGLPARATLTGLSGSASGITVGDYSYNVTGTPVVIQDGTDITNSITFTYEPGSLTIGKRPVTVTTASAQFTYTGLPQSKPEFSVQPSQTNSGLVAGHALSMDLSSFPSITNPEESGKPNTATVSGIKTGANQDVSGNYLVTVIPGTLEMVGLRAITLKSVGASKLYDAAPLTKPAGEGGYEISSGSLLGTDTLVVVMAGSQTNAGSSNNKFASVAIMRAGVNVTSQYTITKLEEGMLVVNKRKLTLKAGDASFDYDGNPHSHDQYDVTSAGDGLAPGEKVKSAKVTGTITDPGSKDNVVSDARISGKNDADTTANYAISYLAGKLTMKRTTVKLEITADSKTRMYNGTPLESSGYRITAGKLLSGDKLTCTVVGEQLDFGNSPNKITKWHITNASGDVSSFYDVTVVEGELTVTKRPVSAIAHSRAFPDDGTTHTLPTYDVIGLAPTDVAKSAVVEGSIISGPPVPNVISNLIITRAGSPVNENYDITYVNGELSVDKDGGKRAITVISASDNKAYDAAALVNPNYRITSGSLRPGDTLRATVVGTITKCGSVANAFAPGSVQVYKGSTNVSDQYIIQEKPGTLTVTARPIAIQAASDMKVYDSSPLVNPGYQLVSGSLAEGDRLSSVKVVGSQTEVGASPNVPSAAVITSDAGANTTANYQITYLNGTLEVVTKMTTYKVNYHYDGVLNAKLGITVPAAVGARVTSYPDRQQGGFRFDHADGLPLVVTDDANKNVIDVWYVSMENEVLEDLVEIPIPLAGSSAALNVGEAIE